MALITLQELYIEANRDYTTLLTSGLQEMIRQQINAGVYSRHDIQAACRVVTPIYPIVVDREIFLESIGPCWGKYSVTALRLHAQLNADLSIKHMREYGPRASSDNSTRTLTGSNQSTNSDSRTVNDAAATDTTKDSTFFEASGSYHVEPTRTSDNQIGARTNTSTSSRSESRTSTDTDTSTNNHTEQQHVNVDYIARTAWEIARQQLDYQTIVRDYWINALMDAVSESRVWRSYGV